MRGAGPEIVPSVTAISARPAPRVTSSIAYAPLTGAQFFPVPHASLPRGSASGSGDWPGLQNRWRALRGVLGGFDSHALPPNHPMSLSFWQLSLLVSKLSPIGDAFQQFDRSWSTRVPSPLGRGARSACSRE